MNGIIQRRKKPVRRRRVARMVKEVKEVKIVRMRKKAKTVKIIQVKMYQLANLNLKKILL